MSDSAISSGRQSPMRSPSVNSLNNLLQYKNLMSQLALPEDDYDHHMFLSNLKLRPSKVSDAFDHLIDELVLSSNTKRRGEQQLSLFRHHWESIICSFTQAVFMRRWLVVSLDKGAYAKSGYNFLKHHGFTYQATKDIVDYLEATGIAAVKKGKVFKSGPKSTRLFPSNDLIDKIWTFFLETEEPFDPPYVSINKPDSGWSDIIATLPSGHSDVLDMQLINEHLQGSQWACKAPVRLVYKHDFLHGGRLVTPFQNLPDRNIRLRINTLLDGKPICEVDFNANHLRLNLGVLAKEYAGDTPYEDIVELADLSVDSLDARGKVKDFITKALGASNERDARGAFIKQKGHSTQMFDVIKAATYERFPNVVLFNGWGIKAQSLEGEILRKVMVEGVKKGISTLPVHDAIAINREHAEWAQEAMARVWTEVVGNGIKTKIKVDYPDI